MAYTRHVLGLSDEEMVKEATALDTALLPPTQFTDLGSKPPLSEWERSFLAGIQRTWTRSGDLTWKQRRALREILTKFEKFNDRRKTLQDVRKETVARSEDEKERKYTGMFDDKKPPLPPPPPHTAAILRDARLPLHRRMTIDDPNVDRRVVAEGAKEVGITFRNPVPKPALLVKNGVNLTAKQKAILEYLKRQRTVVTSGWTSASQIRKALGDNEAKSVRKALEFLTFHKLVEWQPFKDQIVVYRYVPQEDDLPPGVEVQHIVIEKKHLDEVASVKILKGGQTLEEVEGKGPSMDTDSAETPIPPTPPTLTAGKRVLFLTDRANPENQKRIEMGFGAKSIEWFIFGTRSPRQIESQCESIENGAYDLVMLANSFMGHDTSTAIKLACDRAGIVCIRTQKGRFSAVMRAVSHYEPEKPAATSAPETSELRTFKTTDTLMPILQTLMKHPLGTAIAPREVMTEALKDLGLTMKCMGTRPDGRPEVIVPFTNGAAMLARVYGCLRIEGKLWSLTDAGREAAEKGEILARVIPLPVAPAASEPPSEPLSGEVQTGEQPSEETPTEANTSPEAPKKVRGPRGQRLIPWSGRELFRMEQLMQTAMPRAEISEILLKEFGNLRTARTLAQQYARYFGIQQRRKIEADGEGFMIPPDYYIAKQEWEKENGELPSKKLPEVIPYFETEIMPPSGTPAPLPPPPLPIAESAPLVVWTPPVAPAKLRLLTSEQGVEAEVIDPAGNFLVNTTHSLVKILAFLRSGTGTVIHVEIVGKAGSSLTDTKRSVDEIVAFLVG